MNSKPVNHTNPFRAVREFGVSKALKFATLLQHKSEQLSKSAKYGGLLVFLIIALSANTTQMFYSTAPTKLHQKPADILLPYISDQDTLADSLILNQSNIQTNNRHD
ncbi:hypothetical protein LV84_03662 [Algoriphagus ratkowskyi]|uniref:Uncharacterized protein n=1 Tax=Algoriphagus ratkowskyi TaxID=57028 RepID=A0A2W7RLE8_9BACT|nr:hypothetical protein [Algoriphagus ratkowskyi]PZX51505.1 hypothetical protein LV84_03662 [Algoriphagus ratkowskyi]TXD78788.1 hypothetical protein ESW18_04505 [Algoriphagus ratkowskyi]